MGLGGISIWSLLLILLIVLLLFGTKKVRNMGSDLGGAIKGFKSAMSESGDQQSTRSDESDTEEPDSTRLHGEQGETQHSHTGDTNKQGSQSSR